MATPRTRGSAPSNTGPARATNCSRFWISLGCATSNPLGGDDRLNPHRLPGASTRVAPVTRGCGRIECLAERQVLPLPRRKQGDRFEAASRRSADDPASGALEPASWTFGHVAVLPAAIF